MTKDILYLGSQSSSRQKLLHDADIPFKVLNHRAKEDCVTVIPDFHEYILSIARSKMDALQLPHRDQVDKDYFFVVTADTLDRSVNDNKVYGKPVNKQHAIEMIKHISQGPVEVATGCCLYNHAWIDGCWKVTAKKEWVTSTIGEFIIPDDAIEKYLEKEPVAMYACGASVIEGFGLQFLKSLNGSYSAVMGLPLYELRQALKAMSFTFN